MAPIHDPETSDSKLPSKSVSARYLNNPNINRIWTHHAQHCVSNRWCLPVNSGCFSRHLASRLTEAKEIMWIIYRLLRSHSSTPRVIVTTWVQKKIDLQNVLVSQRAKVSETREIKTKTQQCLNLPDGSCLVLHFHITEACCHAVSWLASFC